MEKNKNLIAISGKKNSGKDTVALMIQYLIHKKNHPNTEILSFEEFKNHSKKVQKYQSKYEIQRFADPIKDYVCNLTGYTREQIEDREIKEKELGEEWWYYKGATKLYSYKQYCDNLEIKNLYPLIKHTPRSLMQLVGTEAGIMMIHPDMFVNAFFNKYKGKVPYITEGKIFNSIKWKGTGFCQQCNKNIIHKGLEYFLCDNCCKKDNYLPNWIIPDLRFPNEARAIQERNGLLIRVERPPIQPDIASITSLVSKKAMDLFNEAIEEAFKEHWKTGEHKSETGLDDYDKWDEVIINSGNLVDLEIKVEKILIKRKII